MTSIPPISIRHEMSGDAPAIRTLNNAAFDGPMEANIVDALRDACSSSLSLVAVSGDHVVGHILFSPAILVARDGDVKGMGLAPMAVDPPYQGRGIGSMLVEEGLAILKRQNCPFVIVVGHPEYYPRFGFRPASGFGLLCQWEGVPDDAFMAIIFDERKMKGVAGTVKYRDEFDDAM